MKKKIAIVTGANGFIGSHLVEYLLKKGCTVRCIVRPTSNLQWVEHLDIEIVKCGFDDLNQLTAVFKGANYIYHLAGVTKAKKYQTYLEGNVGLTKKILKACEAHQSIERIIVTSSLAASSPTQLNQPVHENTPAQPISLYGKSKVAMEQMVISEFSHLPYVIVRPPAVYGPREKDIFLFFNTVKNGWISKIGLKSKQLSLVYIEDLIEGMYLATIHENAIKQIYFFTSDPCVDWDSIGDTSAAILNPKARKISIPHFVVFVIGAFAEVINLFQKNAPILNLEKVKEITQEAWTCSDDKARRTLGYTPKFNYQKGFVITLKWYQENGWL